MRLISARKADFDELSLHQYVQKMRQPYDFRNAMKNPYASQLKKSVTIRLDERSISYFKGLADETGIPYQSLINLYLKDCAATGKRLTMGCKASAAKTIA